MLTRAEAALLYPVLELAGDLLGNQGCNDYEVPNTDENWALAEQMYADNERLTVEEWRTHPDYRARPQGKTFYLMDWFVLGHFAQRVKALRDAQ